MSQLWDVSLENSDAVILFMYIM